MAGSIHEVRISYQFEILFYQFYGIIYQVLSRWSILLMSREVIEFLNHYDSTQEKVEALPMVEVELAA